MSSKKALRKVAWVAGDPIPGPPGGSHDPGMIVTESLITCWSRVYSVIKFHPRVIKQMGMLGMTLYLLLSSLNDVSLFLLFECVGISLEE